MNWQYQPLGEILLRSNLITQEQMGEALAEQEQTQRPLGEILVRQKVISEEDLAKALANQKKLEVVNLNEYVINPSACSLISQKEAVKHQLIPIDFRQDQLVVATANPLDVHALDSISLITGYKIIPVVATGTAIKETINQFMPADAGVSDIVELAAESGPQDEIEESLTDEGAPAVRLANTIISEAVRLRASDIHIESEETSIIIRYRIDGVMTEQMRMPKQVLSALVSRIKIISDMDIAEKRLPQDGRASLMINSKKIDLRVSTLPSIKGENLNMRILEREKHNYDLSELGMDKLMLEQFKKIFTKAHGAVLVTGPTGSGKTTTLYAVLAVINSPERKIVTIEDPVERHLEGITQVQINPKSGLTFASGLRAIVRHDPDIIMVGEVRDMETARIAIRAALTGHFVLSTLHTNDAPSTISRLLDMEIEPFLVASSVKSIVAQRLARRLCLRCRQLYLVKPVESMREFGIDINGPDISFYRPIGCRKCSDTGYRGRVAIFELLTMSEEIGKLCLRRASAAEIRRLAVSQGMRTLRQDAFNKARKGITSLEEIGRIL